MVCVRGALEVVVDDGTSSEEVALDGLAVGLYVPPMIWAVQSKDLARRIAAHVRVGLSSNTFLSTR